LKALLNSLAGQIKTSQIAINHAAEKRRIIFNEKADNSKIEPLNQEVKVELRDGVVLAMGIPWFHSAHGCTQLNSFFCQLKLAAWTEDSPV
jgi:hypothetical protein